MQNHSLFCQSLNFVISYRTTSNPCFISVVNVAADLSTCLVDTVSELLAGVLVAAAIQSLACILFTEKNFTHRLTTI
ncbi:hypothetical protein [Ligilactobacillus agilis]|uniref:hypothetical protein n=1 Tax=Ligilactobacillus agilis TaxID=1601 RepID=UPI00265D5ABB|nr:hypothetical protein [Ligilactobacillus agilis]